MKNNSLYPGSCSDDEFTCRDLSACVESHEVCDGISRCNDNSDEEGCSSGGGGGSGGSGRKST